MNPTKYAVLAAIGALGAALSACGGSGTPDVQEEAQTAPPAAECPGGLTSGAAVNVRFDAWQSTPLEIVCANGGRVIAQTTSDATSRVAPLLPGHDYVVRAAGDQTDGRLVAETRFMVLPDATIRPHGVTDYTLEAVTVAVVPDIHGAWAIEGADVEMPSSGAAASPEAEADDDSETAAAPTVIRAIDSVVTDGTNPDSGVRYVRLVRETPGHAGCVTGIFADRLANDLACVTRYEGDYVVLAGAKRYTIGFDDDGAPQTLVPNYGNTLERRADLDDRCPYHVCW